MFNNRRLSLLPSSEVPGSPASRNCHAQPFDSLGSPHLTLAALSIFLILHFGSPSDFPGTIKPTRRTFPTPPLGPEPPPAPSHLGHQCSLFKASTARYLLAKTSSLTPTHVVSTSFHSKANLDYARTIRRKGFQSRLTHLAVTIHGLTKSLMLSNKTIWPLRAETILQVGLVKLYRDSPSHVLACTYTSKFNHGYVESVRIWIEIGIGLELALPCLNYKHARHRLLSHLDWDGDWNVRGYTDDFNLTRPGLDSPGGLVLQLSALTLGPMKPGLLFATTNYAKSDSG
ncbi:hypothetical protein C8R47DRAFT_1217777 [Mycena vitilis]|nr:hypothetical protein C8R47DRAFT_1217777 [Mycena vitilis]